MIERYITPEFKGFWSLERKFNLWLKVELAVLKAREKMGEVSEEVVKKIERKAKINVQRIKQIEEKTQHDVIAFLESLEELIGEESRELHLGLTSYDIVDTALSLQLREAGEIILREVEGLKEELKNKAVKEKYTLITGRTHGIHAEPISLGLKFLVWYEEVKRNIVRLIRAIECISYGKISGACGNYAHISPFIEEWALKELNLKPDPISTQIIQRDRHAEFLFTLAMIVTTCEKIAQEIRHLQRTEIQELEEPFLSSQKGSSAMPHKRNPIVCERICGLARIVKSNVIVGLENIPLWGERDLSNSAPERIIMPESTILTHYIVRKTKEIVKGLRILYQNITKNLNLSKGGIYSGRVLVELMKKGMSRKEAYQIVQESSFKTNKEEKHLKEVLEEKKKVKEIVKNEEIEKWFDGRYFLKHIDHIYERIGLTEG